MTRNRRPLKRVLLFENRAVAVFDYNGLQVRQLQGRASEKWPRILRRADEATSFEACRWGEGCRPMRAQEILKGEMEPARPYVSIGGVDVSDHVRRITMPRIRF